MKPLREIFEQCRSIGLVDSQPECSRMFGRTGSWLSSMLAREEERRISTEALLAFYFSLAQTSYTAAMASPQIQAIDALRADIWSEIARRVRV